MKFLLLMRKASLCILQAGALLLRSGKRFFERHLRLQQGARLQNAPGSPAHQQQELHRLQQRLAELNRQKWNAPLHVLPVRNNWNKCITLDGYKETLARC